MVAPLALIFLTHWLLLITELSVGWQCTNHVPVLADTNGSAIENFSCVIYNVSLMNCTWQAGKDAPGDAQYGLYWRNSRNDDVVECGLYIKDEEGRHTGCAFQDVTIGTDQAYFLVNGSSKDAVIQDYDTCLYLHEIEKLMPPSNITVSCDEIKPDCVFRWQRPRISHSDLDKCFKYEINIQSEDKPHGSLQYKLERGNSYTFPRPNMGKKYTLTMRAAGTYCIVTSNWGEWSAPVVFGSEELLSSSVWILLAVAFVTLSVVIITILFFKRTGCWKAAFPQIPEPKNSLCQLPDTNPEMMERKAQPITSENEDIIVVADMVK